ncbi:hypothetical protein BD769DRAFT_336279 [Suillus cothurnatus]|nr:hypothetical protein BD769DRAFT_336279 [Suillus cothurnatus]
MLALHRARFISFHRSSVVLLQEARVQFLHGRRMQSMHRLSHGYTFVGILSSEQYKTLLMQGNPLNNSRIPVTIVADPAITAPNWGVANNLSSLRIMNNPDASCKCPRDQSPGRNLVICIDGTSNKYCDRNTNIVELYSEMVKDSTQLTYYNSGVGTYAQDHTLLMKYWMKLLSVPDLAFAVNIGQTIMGAYRWLSDTYRPGDKIFLFGFSRGAYQVRVLAGMIHQIGLILPGNIEQIPYAFQLYSAINSGKDKDKDLAAGFKSTFSRQDIVIHFIGVWDTVSSVGIRKEKILPSTDTCDHICYFRHALALDERRVKFLPEYVYGGLSDRSKFKSVSTPMHEHGVKEVWFAGSHSDVGGVKREKTDNALTFRDMPLLWMREEAFEAGLLLNPPKVAFTSEDLKEPKITNSLTSLWWPLEILPIRHLRYNNSNQHTQFPHLGKGRIILPGQKVHASVLFRPHYRSKASFWRNLQQWPEAIYFHVGTDEQERSRSSQDHIWEVPFKRSTAEALVGTIHKKHVLDYVDRLAFMCSFSEISDNFDILT